MKEERKLRSESVHLHLLASMTVLSFPGGKTVTLLPAWSNQISKGENVNGELKTTFFFFFF